MWRPKYVSLLATTFNTSCLRKRSLRLKWYYLHWTNIKITFPSKSVITSSIVEWLWYPFYFPPLIVYSHFISSLKEACTLLSTGRVTYTWNYVGMRKLYSTSWLKLCGHEKIIQYELTEFFNKAIVKVTKIKKRNKIYGFRAADICLLNPDMLTDIESEVNCGDKWSD